MGSPKGDPWAAHILQLKVLEWARTADDDEHFISEAEAEQRGKELIQPDIWQIVKNVVPALSIPSGDVPASGGGARGVLQRTFKEAGLLDPEFDDSREEPSHRAEQALFALRRRECWLTNIFGAEHQDVIHEFAKALDSEEDQRMISNLYTHIKDADMLWSGTRFNTWTEIASKDKQAEKPDLELWALQDRLIARGWDLLRDHVHRDVFKIFVTAILASRSYG